MMDSYQDTREKIYEIMNGFVEKESKPGIDITVRNKFEAGSRYDRLYEDIYKALLRLSSGTGTEEDVESVQEGYFEIIHYLCERMYDYGHQIAILEAGRRH